MKAVKTTSLGQAELQDVPIPNLDGKPGFALVKTTFVGISPSDNLFIGYPPFHIDGITIGSDYCGVVVDIDPNVQHIKKGDRVAGAVFATCVMTKPDAGTYGEYILAKADAMIRLNDMGETTDAQGATLGVSVYTVYRTLYEGLDLPLPGFGGWGKTMLIYGGSTASGLLMMQFAKLSGARIITTASVKNFELVKSYGADVAIDYHDPDACAGEIIEAAGGRVDTVVDCVGTESTVRICDEIMAPRARYFVLTPTQSRRKDVVTTFNPGQDLIGENYLVGGQVVPVPQVSEDAKSYLRLVEKLFFEGKVKHIPTTESQGWDQILQRVKDLREGRLSGCKCVVKVG